MKKILISTGGSGGHVYPGIALYEHIEKFQNVLLVTDIRGSKYIDDNLIKYNVIDVPNIFSNLFKLPLNILLFFFSILKSLNYLKKENIDILLSTGGYMSLPLCIAAKILNKDIILFEPNLVIGRTNKLILRFSRKIICYHKDITGIPKNSYDKIFLTKPIFRKEMYNINKSLNQTSNQIFKIIILGGSQGAKFFDAKIKDIILNLSKVHKISVSQQVHDSNVINNLENFYNQNNIQCEIFRFNKNLYKNLNSFDLAITRSGASAITELAFFKVPFIAVPFPHSKDNHQFLNAKYYADQDCCWLYEQSEFNTDKISNFISNLIKDKTDYFIKRQNLNKISYENSWNNINEKLINLLNEN